MTSTIRISCHFAHARLTDLLRPRIVGQKISEQLSIEDIILGADMDWLYAHVQVSGAYSGQVHVRYTMDYDIAARRFVLNQLYVELAHRGLLGKGASWVVRKFFAQKLDRRLEQLMNDKFDGLLNELLTRYSEYTLENGLKVTADLEDVTFDEINWDALALHCTALAKGTFRLRL